MQGAALAIAEPPHQFSSKMSCAVAKGSPNRRTSSLKEWQLGLPMTEWARTAATPPF
jgi:hypothetical protein